MRVPLDELHDEVGGAVGGGAAVEELGDVGVLERGEDLALVAEAALELVGDEAEAQELDGHLAVVEGIVAGGAVDERGATLVDLLEQPVRTEAHALEALVVEEVALVVEPGEEAGGLAVGGEQPLELASQRGVAVLGFLE
jgi:hypothetical protein